MTNYYVHSLCIKDKISYDDMPYAMTLGHDGTWCDFNWESKDRYTLFCIYPSYPYIEDNRRLANNTLSAILCLMS